MKAQPPALRRDDRCNRTGIQVGLFEISRLERGEMAGKAEAFRKLLQTYVIILNCQALIEGRYDHLPEEVFSYVGAIEQAIEAVNKIREKEEA